MMRTGTAHEPSGLTIPVPPKLQQDPSEDYRSSSHIDSIGRLLFTADANRDNGKRFIVSADERLTAFLELERVTRNDSD